MDRSVQKRLVTVSYSNGNPLLLAAGIIDAGKVIAVTTQDCSPLDEFADDLIRVPTTLPMLMPILTCVPLQLLAYHVATLRGNNVDQPRNLAKSVTVE